MTLDYDLLTIAFSRAALEEKTRKAEQAKKDEANRQAELVKQERMAQE